jgi:homogentisate 1,2-dioxygenase
MFHLNNHFSLTKYALERSPTVKTIPGYDQAFWDDLKGPFMDHLDEVNAKLMANGQPPLGQSKTN